MQAYKNDPQLKSLMLEEVERHRKHDQIIQGSYGEEGGGVWRGCAVGCSIHSLNERLGTTYRTSDHAVYEPALGIPEWLARLEDTLFENLPLNEAKRWPGKFLRAIPVGANLEPVKWQFSVFLLTEGIARVLSLPISDTLKEQVVASMRGVLAVHQNAIDTGIWDESAARSAAQSAESAARSAQSARSAAWSAAWSAAYKRYALHLLSLLRKAT